jgi:hypothetical protein
MSSPVLDTRNEAVAFGGSDHMEVCIRASHQHGGDDHPSSRLSRSSWTRRRSFSAMKTMLLVYGDKVLEKGEQELPVRSIEENKKKWQSRGVGVSP